MRSKMSILSRLNKIVKTLTESSVVDTKNIRSPEYDRQKAEDLLFNTIGPLTENPRFSSSWNAITPMPEGFIPGGESPKWTKDEIAFAMAGDPSLIYTKSFGNPKHPGYGNRGGSPIYRIANRLARKYRKPDLLEDLYSLGLVALSKKMLPGADQSRGAFISWVIRTLESEMEFGVGSTLSLQDLLGYEATKYVDSAGNIKISAPKKEPERTEFLKTHKILKLYGLEWVKEQTDPKALKQAASVVKGPYQKENSSDKDVGNPFAPYSADYYQVVMQYATALASKDEAGVDAALKNIDALVEKASGASTISAGAATGLGQAISQKDRAASATSHIIELIASNPENLKQAESVVLKYKGKLIDKDASSITFSLAIPYKSMERAVNELSPFGKVKYLRSERNMSVVSADATKDDETGSIGSTLADTRGTKNSVDPELVQFVLQKCLSNDPAKLIAHLPRFKDKVSQILRSINALSGVDKELDINDIKGTITGVEYRYLLRGIAPFLGEKYPGMGTPRSKTNVPRDKPGWWSPGEDPEIEPLDYIKKANPEADGLDDTWSSIWLREGMPRMGPTEITVEMTKEVEEFQKLGIPTGRQTKGDKPAVSKQSVNIGYQSALAKFKMMRAIFQDELGLSESKKDQRKVFTEDIDSVDKEMINETFDFLINSVSRILIDDIKKSIIA